jgi:hypothetical protein
MCRNDNIVYGEFPVESSTSQFIYCEDCGAEWYDEYTLTGYSLTAEGTHENERVPPDNQYTFTCPQCGGHIFASSPLPDGDREYICHGYIDMEVPCGWRGSYDFPVGPNREEQIGRVVVPREVPGYEQGNNQLGPVFTVEEWVAATLEDLRRAAQVHGEPGEVLQVDRNNFLSWLEQRDGVRGPRPQTPTREDVRQLAEELRSQGEQLHMNDAQVFVQHNWPITFDGRHCNLTAPVAPHVAWKEEEEE